ncbi:ATP-binding protein [uncultured Microbacterium sp.]|uniref:ATP-binding protein n=1 Tax=uncultured Microbacterium sp. TaxID=191216 RepID=UPI002594161E|nr:ATP-binding protein [uncultured Microbacterium sp.]
MNEVRAIPIPITANRTSISAFEQELFASPDVTLFWVQPSTYANALDRVTLLQALITWARTAPHPTIQFGPGTITRAELIAALGSDELLYAAVLAATILRSDGTDATNAVRQMLRNELARRRILDDTSQHRTLVLSTLEHRLAYSPDVMSRTPEGDSTDWTTRTMFHRVDVASLSSAERELLIGAGEEVYEGPRRGVWLRRSIWPTEHPLSGTVPFTTIGERLLRPSPEMLRDWEKEFPLDTTPADWLGQVVWELFQNTEHHALSSEGKPIARSLRSLIATPLCANDIAMDDTSPLAEYVRERAHRDFVSISVVDSGDGLAFTAAARDDLRALDPVAELKYFQRAVSGDARSPERPLHGFGMTIVGHLLTAMSGFVQIRSGSIVLHRDFGNSQFNAMKRDLTTDWAFDLDAGTEPHRRWGSVVTIVLPRYGVTT